MCERAPRSPQSRLARHSPDFHQRLVLRVRNTPAECSAAAVKGNGKERLWYARTCLGTPPLRGPYLSLVAWAKKLPTRHHALPPPLPPHPETAWAEHLLQRLVDLIIGSARAEGFKAEGLPGMVPCLEQGIAYLGHGRGADLHRGGGGSSGTPRGALVLESKLFGG